MLNSVGVGGVNEFLDVLAYQLLLNEWRRIDGLPALNPDGAIGPKTIGAINHFQQSRLGFQDGLIEPGKATMLKILDAPANDPGMLLRPVVRDLVAALDTIQLLDIIPPIFIDAGYQEIANGLAFHANQLRPSAMGSLPLGFPAVLAKVGSPVPVDLGAVAAAGVAVEIALLFLLLLLILAALSTNPIYKHEVEIRARELSRHVDELREFAKVKIDAELTRVEQEIRALQSAQDRCRLSPTFVNSAECAQAMAAFGIAVAKAFAKLVELSAAAVDQRTSPSIAGHLRVRALLSELNQLMAQARAAKEDMRLKCRCFEV